MKVSEMRQKAKAVVAALEPKCIADQQFKEKLGDFFEHLLSDEPFEDDTQADAAPAQTN
jgi:hypothetical protein